ncbi:hypothetical protein F511_40361 [Dorcoceras hygrometricum]|uniref:Aminotransferase-like plant mobile domain-containing protein n=1 Tax=Dorcoceras hygrometricum TaxID=472368 RepID=A0A2Z7C3I0_9LAMI|nr:hypothetical protein F511_40361 [Dorcoceras hygrometricum]
MVEAESFECDDEEEIDDFVRPYILFIFNSIIFSTGNYHTPAFIFPYLDDLTKFFDYGWGDAAFWFLYRDIRVSVSKTYVDGCTVGLMAWVYERVPSLGVRRSLVMFPSLFQWVNSKIPLNAAKVELLLKSIDSTKILSIYPFVEEKMLLEVKLMDPEDGTSFMKSLQNLLREQMDEIQKLKWKCIELECESLRNSCSKRFVKRLEEFTDDVGKRNDGSLVVSKEDDKSERNTEDVGVVRFDLCGKSEEKSEKLERR